MNISRQNIAGVCNLKCNLAFDYPTSNCTATNHGTMISLTYDNGSVPPVKYNNLDYNVQDVYILSPSRHVFNGEQLPGEIFINHTPTSGGPGLVICIPIMLGSISNSMMENIISQVSTGAANSGESTVIRTDYKLENIVPIKPFFNYSAVNKEWIVFGLVDAIHLSYKNIQTLKGLVTGMPPIMEGPKLFVNTSGPNQRLTDGQIYIDCQPTGSSESTTDVTEETTTPDIEVNFSLSDILKSPITMFLIAGAIFFILILGFSALVSVFSGSKIPMVEYAKKAMKPKDDVETT